MRNILLTGADGQIGWELQRSLTDLGRLFAYDRTQLDLARPDSIVQVMREIKPDIVVNAGAYTAVDQAETEKELAMQINGTAPGILAEEARRLGSILIHYSTDYIFDGSSRKPYSEDDTPNPLNAYGASKLAGETAIEKAGGNYLILRTSWVYGIRGKNFLMTMLKLAEEKKKLKVVNDQVGAPTWSRSIAEMTLQILVACLINPRWGIYHVTSKGSTTWYDFAKSIFEEHEKNHPGFQIPDVTPIPSSDYPQAAVRPKNSLLSNQKLQDTFNLTMPDWKEALSMAMEPSKQTELRFL